MTFMYERTSSVSVGGSSLKKSSGDIASRPVSMAARARMSKVRCSTGSAWASGARRTSNTTGTRPPETPYKRLTISSWSNSRAIPASIRHSSPENTASQNAVLSSSILHQYGFKRTVFRHRAANCSLLSITVSNMGRPVKTKDTEVSSTIVLKWSAA